MDINDLIRQAVQEINAESAAASNGNNPVPAASPQPITVNVMGKPVTFRDQADLEAQLNQTAQAIQAQQSAPPPAPDPGIHGARVSGRENEGPGFQQDKYIQLMNENPLEATNYALSHLMFNGEVEDPASLIRETMINSATQARQLAAYQFRDMHQEVPISDPRVGNVIEDTRKALSLPFTSQGLEAAYLYAVGKGQLPNFQALAMQNAQQAQQYQQNPQFQAPAQNPQTPMNPYLQGPPSAGRSSTAAAPVMVGDLENMTTEQLHALLTKLGSAGAV